MAYRVTVDLMMHNLHIHVRLCDSDILSFVNGIHTLPCLQDAVLFVYNFWQQLLPEQDGIPQASSEREADFVSSLGK